jgi:SpoVK/Ycf46/Vps4 family AAA+-type ATPase
MDQAYINAKYYQIGNEEYKNLTDYCNLLLEEGYWEKPNTILDKNIEDMLALYVQAVLVQLALFSNSFKEEEQEYIINLPNRNMLLTTKKDYNTTDLHETTEKIMKAPPILLQLCSLRDLEKSTTLTCLFLDSLYNILLAMMSLHRTNNKSIITFLMDYFKSIEIFTRVGNNMPQIGERDIFRKISCDEFWNNTLVIRPRPYSTDGQKHEEKLKDKMDKELKNQPKFNALNQTAETTHAESEDNLNTLLMELNELIGLSAVKEEISSLINVIKVKRLREEYNMPIMKLSYHMVYTGNPGTGKTTVARLVAKIYKELGILTKGNLVETDRGGLVAGFVGQTALKVKDVVEEAIGGVLFIDEAYSLTRDMGTNDFGGEAVDALVKLMEDNRDNLVVIVAGYKKEMKRFLASNTGLISRFNKFIEFEDYTDEELLLILKFQCEKVGLKMEEEAIHEVINRLGCLGSDKKASFGNARGIRNLFEKILVKQANRLMSMEKPTKEQLSWITCKDVEGIIN